MTRKLSYMAIYETRAAHFCSILPEKKEKIPTYAAQQINADCAANALKMRVLKSRTCAGQVLCNDRIANGIIKCLYLSPPAPKLTPQGR